VRFDAGDYGAAIAGYGAAYRSHPSPGLLFNLAQAHRLRGDCTTATLLYHQYLREVPGSPYRDVVEVHLDALAPCTYQRTLDGSPEAPGRGRRVAGVALGGGGLALIVSGVSVDGDRALGPGLIGAGVATAITGATLYLLGRRADRAAERYTLRPTAGGAAGVGAVFTASW
jgi:hypothetical protein